MTNQIQMTLIPASEINHGVRHHCSLSEAAALLSVSESALRRAARRLGVTRIHGPSVRGGLLIARSPADVVITYHAGKSVTP